MSNYPYYFCTPSSGIRKGIIDSHSELEKIGKTIYSVHPNRITILESFKNRRMIHYFFENTLPLMEPLTEIERWKKKEALYHKSRLEESFQWFTNLFTIWFGLFKVLRPESEWKYKYSIVFLPEVPFDQLKKRFGWLLITLLFFRFNFVVKDTFIALYYPDLLCDLQIGEDFELGYWASRFVKEIKIN
jgi:hypothetical protein